MIEQDAMINLTINSHLPYASWICDLLNRREALTEPIFRRVNAM
jgi:hypothetical protein